MFFSHGIYLTIKITLHIYWIQQMYFCKMIPRMPPGDDTRSPYIISELQRDLRTSQVSCQCCVLKVGL